METVNYGLSAEDYVVVEQAIKENDLAVLGQFTFSLAESQQIHEAHPELIIDIQALGVDQYKIMSVSNRVVTPLDVLEYSKVDYPTVKTEGIFPDSLRSKEPQSDTFTPNDLLKFLKTLPLEGQVSFMNDLKADLLKEWQERKAVLEKDSEVLTERLNEATDAIRTFA